MNQTIFKQAGFKGTTCRCVATVIAAAAGIFIGQPAEAKITLPEIFSDNMVLQCSGEAAIWGWAAPESTVSLKASWLKEMVTVKAGEDGKWKASLRTGAPSYSQNSLEISEKGGIKEKSSKYGDSIVIRNILLGEVWFCSGQSNMEMPLAGFGGCPVEGCNEAIAEAGSYPGIRFVKVVKTGAKTPQDTVAGRWQVCNANNAQAFSAMGYFFAVRLTRSLGVPVGIIDCSWSGTPIESWLPESVVVNYPDVDFSIVRNIKPGEPWKWHSPSINYNGMVHPLAGYTIKGFTWYQGESNVRNYSTYAERLEKMAEVWRTDWGQGELPFLIVEIAPYFYPDDKENKDNEACGGGTMNARLVEAQHKAAAAIPNSGIICTNDLVNQDESLQVHPSRKKEVGDRLAYMALNKAYNLKGVAGEGPSFKEVKFTDGSAEIFFDHTENGLTAPPEGISGFEVAGADKVFHPAKAEISKSRRSVIVKSEEVAEPVAVRYCFRNFLIGSLSNSRSLPAYPFRTDSW